VKAAQRGDADAFRRLVERYQRRVYQLALGMVKDADEAMDIAQETFMRVHRYLPSFKGDSAFFTWTYRIATNLCLDAARKRVRGERVSLRAGDEQDADLEAAMDPPSAALAGPQRAALNEELKGKLLEALEGLSENHRAILLLREVDGLSYEDLSKVLGIRKGTVMSRLFHARLKMQNKLREYLGEDAPEGKGGGSDDEPAV
jgi:RNA polymerase sigma-70 factor (ECF subfamily)